MIVYLAKIRVYEINLTGDTNLIRYSFFRKSISPFFCKIIGINNMMTEAKNPVLRMTATIVSSYLARNALPSESLPKLITSVHDVLQSLGDRKSIITIEEPKRTPATDPRKSIGKDYIVCLEDGKRFKSLKRHLSSKYNMTPEEYRQRWNLPDDYPMVAPNYRAVRSNLAKKMGLGRKSGL